MKIMHYGLGGFRKRKQNVSILGADLNFCHQLNKGELFICQSLFKRHLIKVMIYS